MLNGLRISFILAVLAALLAGCDFSWLFNILNPPTPKQFAGSFDTLAVEAYASPGASLVGVAYDPITEADTFARVLKTSGTANWTENARLTDADVCATSFQKDQQVIDALLFEGHGTVGLAALLEYNEDGYLTDQLYWGVGDTSDGIANLGGSGCGGGGSGETFPVGGRLKWMFLYSSDTVAAPPGVDPSNPQWTSNWNTIFSGSLHGLYGAWQSPGSCSSQGTRTRNCDIVNSNVASCFSALVVPVTAANTILEGLDIHDSWVQAFSCGNQDGRWAIWEDSAARNDLLSGPGPGSPPPAYTGYLSGNLMFYYASDVSGYNVASVTVAPNTFILNPQSLTPEVFDRTSLTQEYESQSSTPVSVSDDGMVYRARASGGAITYQYGTSGAVMYFGSKPTAAMAFTQATAMQAAETYVGETLGMPSDASPYSVFQFWQYSPSTGAAINDAYEFIWHHSDPSIAGADAIKVVVADRHITTRTCEDWIYNDPPIKPICDDWQEVSTDTPYISSAYRLWRTTSGAASNSQPVGTTSIDAVTAASALPAGANVTAYQPGLWMPDPNTSYTVGARSAWIFTIGGTEQIAVDAYTGQVLGSVTER
jgi:hypothetical protein